MAEELGTKNGPVGGCFLFSVFFLLLYFWSFCRVPFFEGIGGSGPLDDSLQWGATGGLKGTA